MNIAIVGLGYVGLPLALQFARNGVSVIGLDVDLNKVDAVNQGQSYIKHIEAGAIAEQVSAGRLRAASDFSIVRDVEAVLRESLTNVAKHARAASVTVILEGRADAVSLIIEDDGVGFDAEHMSGANDKGLGLVGIRERAALVGGTAEVESQPGEGTRVIVRIPAPPRAQRGDAHE